MKSGKDDSIFVEILSDKEIFSGFHRCFLNQNESYEDDEGKIKVQVRDKLQKIYEYLFSYNYDSPFYDDNSFVGSLAFTLDVRNKLFKLESLFDKEAEILYTNDKE